jgi:hypothetical protein
VSFFEMATDRVTVCAAQRTRPPSSTTLLGASLVIYPASLDLPHVLVGDGGTRVPAGGHRPQGRLLWLSPALPGRAHDLTAARTHRIIRICERQGVPILADLAYQGGAPG